MENIKVFSLLNGREILGTVKEETDTSYILTNAVSFGLHDMGNNQVQIIPQFVSFLAETSDNGININVLKTALAFEPFEPNSDVLAQYVQIKSPIQLINKLSSVKGLSRN